MSISTETILKVENTVGQGLQSVTPAFYDFTFMGSMLQYEYTKKGQKNGNRTEEAG